MVGYYERKLAVRARIRGSVAERKLASRISKGSAQLRADIPKLLEDNPLLELVIEQRWPGRTREAFLSELKHCEETFGAFAEHVKKGAVPRQGQLHLLLHRLAEIYLDSGGTSTAVSNNRRKSAFIDFAWKIIEKLPVRRRPNSRESLATSGRSGALIMRTITTTGGRGDRAGRNRPPRPIILRD